VSAVKKFQITNHKYQMVRQAHHLTTLSQVEGQITMTEIQNPKQLAFDPPAADLDIVIWNLFDIWCLVFVIFGLSGLGTSLCSL